MEELMYYVWQQKLFQAVSLVSNSADFEIIDVGNRNLDSGPDFFNAKIKIDGMLWAGNVEMHVRASDWYKHHHQLDAAYNNVILHVVMVNDAQIVLSNGEVLLQAVMSIPDYLVQRFRSLQSEGNVCFSAISCYDRVASVPKLIFHDWLTSLAIERMMAKVSKVQDLIFSNNDSWNEAFYVILARAFGTGINSDAFEMLARSLPYAFIKKHADNLLQVEALLLGQGGFLSSVEDSSDEYIQKLSREYVFLKAKFGLKPLSISVWKMSKLRPAAFPPLRLAFLAKLLVREDNLFSRIVEFTSIDDFVSLFAIPLDGFWNNHYMLSNFSSVASVKTLGKATIHSLIINAIVPILVAYYQWKADEDEVERSISLLENLPSEKNRYISMWNQSGIISNNAFESQALLQLYKEYCVSKKCLRCRLGCWLMKR